MVQQYQLLVQEDLNVGTGDAWVRAPAGGLLRGTQVGLNAFARGQVSYSETWAPGMISAGSETSVTLTVPDATIGDFVMASHDKILTNDIRMSGHINAADTVRVVAHNPTAAGISVASGTLSVLVFLAIGAALPSSIVQGTITDGSGFAWAGTVSMTVDGVPWPGGDTMSNALGFYQFTGVPAGSIVVTANGNPGAGTTSPPTTLVIDIAFPPF